MANRTVRTPKKDDRQEAFLAALADGHTVKHAATSISVARRTVYEWREEDAGFRAAWDAAVQEGTEALEQEARRRAVDGTLEPVFHQGQEVGQVRKYSDTLLIFLLKGRKPDTYRDNVAVEQKGKIQHEHSGRLDLKLATDEELDILERLVQKTNGHANGVPR